MFNTLKVLILIIIPLIIWLKPLLMIFLDEIYPNSMNSSFIPFLLFFILIYGLLFLASENLRKLNNLLIILFCGFLSIFFAEVLHSIPGVNYNYRNYMLGSENITIILSYITIVLGIIIPYIIIIVLKQIKYFKSKSLRIFLVIYLSAMIIVMFLQETHEESLHEFIDINDVTKITYHVGMTETIKTFSNAENIQIVNLYNNTRNIETLNKGYGFLGRPSNYLTIKTTKTTYRMYIFHENEDWIYFYRFNDSTDIQYIGKQKGLVDIIKRNRTLSLQTN
ncbi:hypothetical protein CIB95_15305 [Lottiidibacillus patelloidae]|uniref:Uncharacterized protein n=1 Tax=Lottiidibacillus patelloidae TaxID=2670334 RepID=A0A263BQG3_9BACI|nr:hypothetical protein [Lottiidibacillus patelloidae]OZM55802.1 hypothetical protein CIB95_15305 [Lottiidibacillus patelloidae]